MVRQISNISFLVFALLLMILPSTAAAHNGAVALAYPVDGIVIDGNLDDWPEDMHRYPITFVEYGDPIENAGDFEGWFRIGYNAQENAVYLAVEVRDESAVHDPSFPSNWQNTDGCNVYINSSHAEKDSVVDQFITYGSHRTARVSKQAVQWEWKRQDGLYRYEWRLNIDKIGGNSIGLKAGMTIGWDIAICDKDSDGSFSWVSWGKGADKRSSQEKCGAVVLIAAGQSTGWLKGQVTWQNTLPEMAGENVTVSSLESDDLWVRTKTDQNGVYRIELPEGSYQVEAGQDRRKSAKKAVEIRSSEQARADLDILGARGWTVTAGPGKSVKAVGGLMEDKFHLRTPYGLTNVAVRAIVQSHDSFLWLATNQGLARYDGEMFTFFSTEDGLPNNDVHALMMDRLGQLWIGTSGGMCVYDGETFTHFTVEDGLIDNGINSLLEDSSGQLWVGTSRGASVYDGKTFTHFTTEDGLRFNDIIALLEDSSGRIWIGTSFGGVSVYDGETFTHFTTENGLIHNRIRALLEDSSGKIWIGTQDAGVSVYDGENFTNFTREDGLADKNVSALLEDGNGRVWIGGTSKGLSVYDQGKFDKLATGDTLPYAAERAFLEDREGNLWWGTDNGLIRYDNTLMVPVTANALLGRNMRTLLEDSASRIWLGTPSGVSVYDGNSVTNFTEEDGLPRDHVLSLLEDSSGRIWIGTRGNGVNVYDGDSFSRFDTKNGLIGSQVRTLMEDSTGRVWIGTNTSISVYDGGQFSSFTIEDGLLDNDIRTLLEDGAGNVWIGTAFGVSVYDGESFTSLNTKDGLVSNNVHVLLEDSSGRIWIGTRDAGVSVYDGESFTNFTKKNGLVSNNVRTLLEDRTGQIWIGTGGGGISRYDGKSFQILTHEDGLPSDNINKMIEDKQGDIWIATVAGVVRYHRPRHTPPPVSLVDVVTDRRRGPIDRIRLPSTQSLLAFEYRGLSFKTRPGGMVYRYRLKGYETQWQTTHSRRVEYHDLPRGDYTFEVQAIDRDLSYSEIPVQVAVAVHLPYQLITFWLSVTVAVALGVREIIRVSQRGRKLRVAHDELELSVEERTAELSMSNAMLIEEIVQRKKIEELLKVKDTAIASSISAMALTDLEGKLTYVNDSTVKMWGYDSADEILGRCLPEFWEGDGVFQTIKALREEGGKIGEDIGKRKDGSLFNVQFAATMIKDEAGNPLYMFGSFLDVTERKKAEEALLENNKIMERIFETTHFHVVLLDSKFNFIRVNKAYVDTCGFESDYFIGKNHFDLYPNEELESEFRRVINTGDPYIVHSRPFEFPDQPERGITYWDLAVYPVNKASGEVEGLLFTLLEVTERKKAEEALRESEERYHTLFSATNEGVALHELIYDKSGEPTDYRILDVNPAYESILGIKREEAVGAKASDLYGIGEAPYLGIYSAVAVSEDSFSFETYFEAIGKYFKISVFSPAKGKFATLFADITERKRAEEALRESEQKYKTLFESAGDALFTMDFTEEGAHFLDCNERTLKLFGCTHRDQIIGKTPEDFSPPTQPDGQSSAEKALNISKAVMEGHPQIFEWMHCRLDGTSFWVEVNLNRMELKGKPHMQAVVRDITERKGAEEALKKSEGRFKVLFESAPDAYYIHDLEGNFIDGNKAAEQLTDYSREEALGKNFFELGLVAEEDIPKVSAAMADNKDGKPAGPQELTLYRKDGSKVMVETRSYPVEISGQIEVLGIARDITERKRLEEAYHSLVDHSIQGLAIVQDERIVFTNKALTTITGYSEEDMSAASPEQYRAYVHPEDREMVWARNRDRIAGKSVPPRYEFRWIRKDGSTCWVEIHSSRIEYMGRPAIQAAFIDITERKRMEEQLVKSKELFSTAFYANPIPATITTVSNDKLLMVNNAWLKLIGFDSQENVIGKSAVDLDLWADIVDREERNTNLQESGSSDIQEMQVKTPSGRIRDCLYTAEMIEYEGRPHILSMAIDITDRKRAEREIQESEHFTKTIVSSVGEGVIVYDRNLRYLVWNKLMENLTGMSAEEVLGEYSLDLFPHLREQGVDKLLELALTGETVFAPAMPYNVPGTGKKGWVLGTYSPHRAVNGEIIGVVATIHDITERIEAQEALKESREEIQKQNKFLNNVLESLTYPFLVIDANNYKVKIANAAARLSMLSEESTCYMLSHKLNKPCDESGCSCPIKDIKDTGNAMTMEHVHQDRNGNPQHVEVHSCPIMDDKGDVTDIIEYCLDITKRKRAEEKLIAYQAQLRSLASELSLAEERQRHQIATELHDNTSQELAFALTKLQYIRETASGDSLESLTDVCAMMNNVVENVRNMTFDICSPTLYKFGLETALSELLEDKLGTHDEVSYSFCDDKKIKALAEDVKVALFQSVRELVNNLIKHARANNVTVDIRRCKDTIRIAVSDDGVGFKVEELESSERSRSGFGLFSIAERLKYIGGSFEFQSQPGHGSTFTLEAPLEADAN